jgi:hypothetical protein
MSDKTLGQIAHETSEAVWVSKYPEHARPKPIQWKKLSGTHQEAWEAAAQAVANAYQLRALVPDEEESNAIMVLVEAAKVWFVNKVELDPSWDDWDDRLYAAVKDLEELEQ